MATIPPELRLQGEPKTEHTLSGEGDPIHQSVRAIGDLNNQARDETARARQGGVIDEAQTRVLQQERSGCLIIALSAISRVVPTRFKPRLYDALERNNLDRAYIASLNPQRQAKELDQLLELYHLQISYSFYDGEDPQQRLATAEKRINGFLTILDRRGFDEKSKQALIEEVAGLSWYNSDKAGVNMTDRTRLARRLVNYGLAKGTPDVRKELIVEYAERFTDDPSSLLTHLSQEEQPQVVEDILKVLEFRGKEGVFSRGDYIFRLLDGLNPDQRQALLPYLMKQASSIGGYGFGFLDKPNPEQVERRVATAKRILAYASESSRMTILKETTDWSRIIAGKNAKSQLDQITGITNRPQEQDTIFWAVASNTKDYRGHPDFDINATVARAEPDRYRTSFVDYQIRQGFLAEEATAAYGSKIIAQQLEAESIDIRDVAAVASCYKVNVAPYQDRLLREIEGAFRSGSLTREGAELAKQLRSVEFATGWEQFRYDVQASPELGERTWRKEQSIIDTLQNHLDANDFRYAYQLVVAALGREEADRLLAGGRIAYPANQLWKFKERYPFPENEGWRYKVYSFSGSEEELAKKIAGVEKAKPAIQVLVNDPDLGMIWIDHEQIGDHPASIELKGVRFTDNGLGYDEQLNAKFIPTKDEFEFLRGKFGQGAKMSMIALQREGCQIKISSAYVDPETGERIEWNGTPAVSDRTHTVEFVGNKKRSFTTGYLNSTGSATEILFDFANPATKQLFQEMFDLRLNQEGIGKYVLDYQTPNTYQYGAFENDIQISASPSQTGRVYVQGLEVPAQNIDSLGCGYNLPSTEFLTGADRKYLEVEKFKGKFAEAWAGVTDKTMLNRFYNLVLGRSDISFPVERSILMDLSYRLRGESKNTLHKEAMQQALGLDETHQRAVLVSQWELRQTDVDVIDKLRAAGFSVNIDTYNADFAIFADDLFGIETVYGLKRAVRMMEGNADESFAAPEQLGNQFNDILARARGETDDILEKFGLTNEITRLEGMKIAVEARKLSDKTDRKWVERVPVYDQEKNQYVGFKIIVYPESIVGTKQVPEVLSEADATYLQFLMEMELLTLSVPGQNGFEAGRTKFIFGQDISNRLIKAGIDPAQSPEFARAQAITIRPTDIDLSSYSAAGAKKHVEQIVALDTAVTAADSYDLTIDDIRRSLGTINSSLSQSAVAKSRSYQVEGITGRQYFENSTLYEIKAQEEGDTLQKLEIVEVPYQLLGTHLIPR